MASNVLIQNPTTFNVTPKMDAINGNIIVECDKNVIKSETNDENLSNLMEKLHSKANQMKSWTDLAKIMKQSVNEKRHIIDVNERNQLQKCLDTIQKNIRVTSLQSMVERLETICRQLGLKFSVPPQTSPKRVECFVHSEMYYVEVLLEAPNGDVLDCKVAHQAEALSCPQLTHVLKKGDFVEFTKHLEGLSAIYNINADKKNKTKAYLALHALEVDLSSLAELQNHQINDINNLVHKSPVGILEPRKGGHPMRLTYFVPPYDLIDLSTKSCLPLNVDVILEKGLGFSATICIESSSSHRLQHESLINTLKTPEGKNLPQFSALTALNSTQLPACFVLKLAQPLVTSLDIMRKIRADTNIEFTHELINKSEPIIQLIAKQLLASKKEIQPNGPFYVKLPNQSHCYHLNEGCDKLDGVVITSIPITHPTHVPRILVHLRQQVLFNVIIGSFIRQTSKPELISNIFEVTTTSMSNINIQFEHPTEESLATLDLDLRDVTNVKCKLYPTSSLSSFCSDDFASKVMQRCLSIPVTMRSIINKCKERAAALKEQMAREQPPPMTHNQNDLYFSSLNSTNGSLDPNLGGKPSLQYLSQTLQQYNNSQSAQLQQQMNHQFVGQNNSLQGQQQNLQRFLAQKMQHQLSSEAGPQNRPQMTLQQFQQQQELLQQNQLLSQNSNGQKHNTMLMSMLSDIPAANSQMALNLLKQQQQQQHLQQQIQLQQHLQYMQQQQQQSSQQKPKKQRKRKITNDNMIRSPGSSAGKSPKRKLSDEDFNRELPDDGLSADTYQWDNDPSNACRPLSSSAAFAETIGNIKQELNISGATTPTSGGTDAINSFSYMNPRHPFDSNQNDFNEFNANELPLYGESGAEVMSEFKPTLSLDMCQPLISAKTANKRTAKRMKSDASDDASGTGDEGHNEQLKIIKSLEDLHQKESFSKFFAAKESMASSGAEHTNLKKPLLNNIKVSKTSNKSDVRRCSSAGMEGGLEQKRSTDMNNSEDIAELTASLKKERKRKRAESVDSLKASALTASSTTGRSPINSSNICSESSMMPPPISSSTGDVTSSSCLQLMEANQQKLVANMKMSPTSSNVGPLPSPTVMKISSSGKKSLIGGTVSSTSGSEAKLSKGLANKLEKNSTLSSALKNQKHNYLVSPKASDSETTSTPTPSLSPKSLTFKTSKSKGSKSGLNSSPGRTKEYIKSQGVSGSKQKSGITSTSSLSAAKSGSTVSSSSSLSPGLSGTSSSTASSVSSSKQQTAKVAKISRKSSLTAVVDRLHQKQDATGVPTGPPGAPNEGGRPESSSLSTSRPDTTSVPKVSQSGSKTTEPKTKYSRTSDQFTIKQSNSGGGLKMSITKTKLSAADNTNKIGPGGTGLFKTTPTSKFTIPKLPKANSSTPRPASTSISPSTMTTTSSSSAAVAATPLVRRQNTPNNPKVTGNMRQNVSSSTHPSGPNVSPKGSTGAFIASHNKPSFGDRNNVKTSPNQTTNKSAVNKSLTEKFKTNSEPSSTTKNAHGGTEALSSSTNIFPVLPKSLVETSRPPVYSKFDGVTLPMPVGYARSLSASAGSVSPQLPQPSTTSTLQTNKPIFSKSISVNETENIERLLSNWGQTQESATIESGADTLAKNMTVSSNKNIENTQIRTEKAGVSSSSDVKASTSTPSSPAEMALITDALQNPPPLIPIEAIDDSSEGGSGGSASVEASAETENSTQMALDSTEVNRDCRPSTASIASESIPVVSAIDVSNEVSTSDNTKTESTTKVETEVSAVSQSRVVAQVVSESNKETVEEDEDGDGLVIDDPSVPSKPVRVTTASNLETVSSSTSRLNESQKCSTSPTSSSAPPITTNPVLAITSMPINFSSVASPSNHSTNSSVQRPSPYPIDIDDDLMDEALVGSND